MDRQHKALMCVSLMDMIITHSLSTIFCYWLSCE
nr:MAG TPA: hypothetical protein [Caudoviricetes sp.]